MNTIREAQPTLLSLLYFSIALFILPTLSPAAPAITWSPENVSKTLAQGETDNVSVSFLAGKDLENVTLAVVPEISPYVSVTPNSFASVSKGEKVIVTLSFAAAEDAPVGTFEGTVQVRGSSSPNVYAKPLPISITIISIVDSGGLGEGIQGLQTLDAKGNVITTYLPIVVNLKDVRIEEGKDYGKPDSYEILTNNFITISYPEEFSGRQVIRVIPNGPFNNVIVKNPTEDSMERTPFTMSKTGEVEFRAKPHNGEITFSLVFIPE